MEILNLRATTSILAEFDGKSEGQETRFDPVTLDGYGPQKGVVPGARHQFLVYRMHRLSIPSNTEYSVPQLRNLGVIYLATGKYDLAEKYINQALAIDPNDSIVKGNLKILRERKKSGK